MMIRDMFAESINRPINGVIKVDQKTDDVITQEVKEYVITKELKKRDPRKICVKENKATPNLARI